ncbi:MAG: glycosyltransferase, partial [Thermodesulfobacteriota bacterium]|nr:glycosyltransferase [Thermodesulfobacteriota bacterium]
MTRQAEKQLREIRCAVVIRTKDRPRHLLQALKSVQGQIRKPDEVVVVNDGGSSVVDVLSEFEDLLIIPVVHRESLGRAEAGNAGVNASTADAVCFLDDDDRFFPDHLQRLELCMLRFDAKVAYSGSRMVRQDLLGEDEPEQRFFAGEFNDPFDPDRLLFENYIPLNTLMIDRLLFIEVGGFDPSFDLFEDWDLLLRLSLKTRFYHLDRVTSEYAIWGESQQITLASRTDEWRTAYEKFFSRNFLPVKDHEKVVIMADYWMLSQQRRSIIQSQEERIKGLEKELNRLNDLHRTLLDDKSAYETERQIQEEKISALLEDKSAHETERQIQEEKISALHTEIEHLNTCIGQMKQRINDLNQSVPITLSNHDIMNWLLHCRPGNEILPDDPVVKEYNRLAAWVKDQAETQHRTAVSAGDLFRHLKTGLSDLKDQTSFLLNQLHRSKMKKIWRGIPIPQVTEILDKIQSLCRLPEPDSGQTFFPESFLLSLKKSDVQAHINQQEHVNQQVCEDFIPVFEAAAGSGEKSFVFANVSNTPYVHPFALTSEK